MTDKERRDVAAQLIAERMELLDDIAATRETLERRAAVFSRLGASLIQKPESVYIDPGDGPAMIAGNVVFRRDWFDAQTFEALAEQTGGLRESIARLAKVEKRLGEMRYKL